LETGKGKRIRRLEDQSATLTADKKLRRFGPSAIGGLREALSAALGWRQEREKLRR